MKIVVARGPGEYGGIFTMKHPAAATAAFTASP